MQDCHSKLPNAILLYVSQLFGNGAYTAAIYKEASSIRATDFSKEMVEETSKKFKNDDKICVEQADCHKTDYQDESFDTILMANIIHVIDEP